MWKTPPTKVRPELPRAGLTSARGCLGQLLGWASLGQVSRRGEAWVRLVGHKGLVFHTGAHGDLLLPEPDGRAVRQGGGLHVRRGRVESGRVDAHSNQTAIPEEATGAATTWRRVHSGYSGWYVAPRRGSAKLLISVRVPLYLTGPSSCHASLFISHKLGVRLERRAAPPGDMRPCLLLLLAVETYALADQNAGAGASGPFQRSTGFRTGIHRIPKPDSEARSAPKPDGSGARDRASTSSSRAAPPSACQRVLRAHALTAQPCCMTPPLAAAPRLHSPASTYS